MFTLDKYRVKIRVDKEPGLYTFEPFSATGKSYLCKLCKMYHDFHEKVAGYDFYDFQRNVDIPQGMHLLVIDRYDMFPQLDDKLVELARETIVLVDSKTMPVGDVCQVKYVDKGNIVVY